MNFKIDTKEKFTVISPVVTTFTANMTEEITNLLLPYLQKDVPHIVLNMKAINDADEAVCALLADIQMKFYEKDCSFVICGLQKPLEEKLDSIKLLEVLNVTPTESEAWDIVQMEEIERELLGGEE